MSSSSNAEDLDVEFKPPEILSGAKNATDCLLPLKSKEKYLIAYENFILWKSSKKAQSFSENVFLAYFNELANKYKPTSLWAIYSMLKSTVRNKNGIDIQTYSNLIAFLKRRSDGYRSRKSKVLSSKDVEKFLKEAPDSQYLATKVALIFGITGACRRQELNNLTTKDIENHGKMLYVKITETKNKIPRSFTIHGPFYEIVKKYKKLRSTKAKTDRFFQNFQKGKCTSQPIGINKFGAMPKEVAKFLELPDADSYTGHSFRRTSATLLADSGADTLTLKRHGGWRSNTVAKSYVEDSIQNKTKISAQITQDIKLEMEPHTTEDIKLEMVPQTTQDIKLEMEPQTTQDIKLEMERQTKKFCPEPRPSTSSGNNTYVSTPTNEELRVQRPSTSYENYPLSPTFTQDSNNEVVNNTITQTVQMPSKPTAYHFTNCTFTNSGWRSNTVAESYVEASNQNKTKISAQITQDIKLEMEPQTKKFCPEPRPSTSSDNNTYVPTPNNEELRVQRPSTSYENYPLSPTFTQDSNNEVVNNTIPQTVQMPSKPTAYHFTNCTFTNCFNN